MKKHINIRVQGLVQGVFFRASTKAKADSLNIFGLVRNEADGSVYIEAEGEEILIKKFAEWCQLGPPAAQVDKCDLKEAPLKHYSRFVIDRSGQS